MSANSNLLLLFLVILQSVLSAGQSTASTILLITGHSSNNIYKYAFAQKFASQVELDRAHSADIVVISSDLTDTVSQEEGAVLQKLGGIPLSANITQVVLSRLGVDEMSLDHIQVLFQYIDNDEPLIAVEIGEQSVQMRSLLKKGALCWGEARANILSPNTAYLCNDVSPEAVKKVADIDSIHAIEEGTRLEIFEPQPRPFWPSLFASAAKAEKKHRRKQAEEVIEVDDDVEEIVDQIMENIQETPSKHHKIDKPTDKKLSCKYRRSCYDSGQLPEIEKSNTGWYDLNTINNLFTFGGKKEDETHDESDGDKDEISRKLECKYRLDCYKRKGIKLTGKDEEREERKSLLAGQATPQTGKKRTLKEIAEKTVKNVKVAQEKAAARPIPASIITERKLNKIEEKLTEKLQCKYRKSCYETGELPIIASSWSLPDFSTHTAEEAVQEVDFKEMEDLERKMFCKYRKSCYETGVKPDIEPEIRITTFADLGDLPDVIETRKMTIQEKCKYRKSCYESGILPEINPHLEEAIHKEVSTVIPTNMDELKKFCKYRKSCYEEIASSASVETVKNIRKRRIVEKEVRRRKARRSRMRRRLRDIQLEPIGTEHHHKNKHYTVQHPEPEVPVEDDVITEKVSITKPRKTKEKAAKQEEEKQEPEKTKAQKKKISIAAEVPKQSDLVEEEEEVQQAVDEASKPKKRVRKSPDVIREPEAVKRKESPVEVSEPVPDEQEQVEESTPIPEPPKPKKVKKTSKKTPEPREEPKVEPEVIEQLKKKEEEEEDKEKLGYEENQKLQYHCKYRKSCYESKERPVIHQTVSTLYNTFDTHVNEHYNSLENQDISEADKKLACKYRKSCYESNERPVIVQTFSTIWAGAEPVREDDNDDEIKFHNELEKKVYCKYRLSCYETNKRPRIGQTLSSILTGKPVAQATKNEDGHEALEKDHSWHSEEHKKMACKYRQSCYDKHSWKFGQEEDHKKPEPAKESQKLVPEVKPIQEPKRDKKNDEIITEKKAKGSQKEPEKPKSVPKSENSEEEAEEEHIKVSDEVLPDLGRGQKLGCKYRKSCYLDAPSMEPPTRAVSSNGSHQRVKCNEYYLSCREKLGLPPKEKAPMGPNGKKLCRRKKIDQ